MHVTEICYILSLSPSISIQKKPINVFRANSVTLAVKFMHPYEIRHKPPDTKAEGCLMGLHLMNSSIILRLIILIHCRIYVTNSFMFGCFNVDQNAEKLCLRVHLIKKYELLVWNNGINLKHGGPEDDMERAGGEQDKPESLNVLKGSGSDREKPED